MKMPMQPWITPSILAADFAQLGAEVASVLSAGANAVHFDVMDQHYVPNLTVGPVVCEALRRYGITAPIDVHLMVKPVDLMIERFIAAGATYITFHPEASDHIDRSLQMIKAAGCYAGLALNPATSVQCLEHVWQHLDLVLVMSVNPGFGGQSFLPSVLPKITAIREKIATLDHHVRLQVDGGVNADTIAEIAAAGADTFVAGTAIFGQTDYVAAIEGLRAEINHGLDT